MKKIFTIMVVIRILIAGARFKVINAADHGFADLPPSLPVGDGGN